MLLYCTKVTFIPNFINPFSRLCGKINPTSTLSFLIFPQAEEGLSVRLRMESVRLPCAGQALRARDGDSLGSPLLASWDGPDSSAVVRILRCKLQKLSALSYENATVGGRDVETTSISVRLPCVKQVLRARTETARACRYWHPGTALTALPW